MYDEILLERNLHPEFRGKLAVAPIELVNLSCGDQLKIFLEIEDDVIVDGKWDGYGCAIAQASADLFIASIIGKKIEDAKQIKDEFYRMVIGEKIDKNKVDKAVALECVSRMPARVKCAKLAWESLEKIA